MDSIVVMGQITGNIIAKDKIDLKATARLTGDIKAKRLAVEDGVTFVGKSEVNPSGLVQQTVSKPPHESTQEHDTTHEHHEETNEERNKSNRFFGKK